MKRLTGFLALFLFAALPLSAADLSDLTWTTTNGEVTITDCDEAATGELIIPDTIEGNPVTSIGPFAFYNCSSLTSITIGNSVTSIGDGAFTGCSALTRIEVGAGNVNYTEVNRVLFNTEMTLLHTYPAAKTAANYVIPNSVTSIGAGAFASCSSLTSITIPDSVTSVGDGAFFGCNSLTSITIPDGVTSIGESAFFGCSSLTSITIHDRVTSIGERAFYECTSLAGVTMGDGVTHIGALAFALCIDLKSITIPYSVTSFGDYAFGGCSSLSSITFLGTAPTVGANSFGVVADGARAYVGERFVASFGTEGSTWTGLTVAIKRAITACGFMNATTFFIEFEPAGAGYRVMSSPTLDFGNAAQVTPTLEPTSAEDNRFEFAVSGARNFYRIEPTE